MVESRFDKVHKNYSLLTNMSVNEIIFERSKFQKIVEKIVEVFNEKLPGY